MSLADRINQGIKTAMKAKDKTRLRTLRAVKSQILLQQTDGSGEALSEEKGIQMLQKMIKQRRDSVAIFEEQGREDLAAPEREEIEVIQEFLPEQLSAEALEAKVKEIIEATGASSMKDMGKVMGRASQAFAGKAEGKAIADAVKKLLSA